MYTTEAAVLAAIDEVADITLESSIDVYASLLNEYEKTAVILEEYNGNNIEGYTFFQEGAIGDEVKKMGEGQNAFVRILTLIPRLIVAIFRVVKSKLSKAVEKGSKESKKLGKSISNMTDDVKSKLFSKKTDKNTKKKIVGGVVLGLGVVGTTVGAVSVAKKAQKAPDIVKKKIDENKKQDDQSSSSDQKNEETKVPEKVTHLVEAIDNLNDFYQKYIDTGAANDLPDQMGIRDGKMYAAEQVSKLTDELILTMDDLDRVLNGENIKKFHRYTSPKLTATESIAMITEGTIEECNENVRKAFEKFKKNEDRLAESIKKACEATKDAPENLTRKAAKKMGKDAERIDLIRKMHIRLVDLHEKFKYAIGVWDKVVDIVHWVNECFYVSDEKDDSYKSQVSHPDGRDDEKVNEPSDNDGEKKPEFTKEQEKDIAKLVKMVKR